MVKAAGLGARVISLLTLWLAGPAAAADPPQTWTVEWISVPSFAGAWKPVTESGEARVIRAAVETPLQVGMALATGEALRTAEARVGLVMGEERITVGEGAALTLGDRSVGQQLGELWYAVERVFSVQHGTTWTYVEGTRFSVSTGPQGERVVVSEGVVRTGDQRLARFDALVVSTEGVTERQRTRAEEPPARKGRPALLIGATTAIEAGSGGLGGRLRLDEELALLGPFGLQVHEAMGAGGLTDGASPSAGLALTGGGRLLRGAIGLEARLDIQEEGAHGDLLLGPTVGLAARLPLTHRLGLLAAVDGRLLDIDGEPALETGLRGGVAWSSGR